MGKKSRKGQTRAGTKQRPKKGSGGPNQRSRSVSDASSVASGDTGEFIATEPPVPPPKPTNANGSSSHARGDLPPIPGSASKPAKTDEQEAEQEKPKEVVVVEDVKDGDEDDDDDADGVVVTTVASADTSSPTNGKEEEKAAAEAAPKDHRISNPFGEVAASAESASVELAAALEKLDIQPQQDQAQSPQQAQQEEAVEATIDAKPSEEDRPWDEKMIQPQRSVDELEAFGATIQTPKPASVSKVAAKFDKPENVALMPDMTLASPAATTTAAATPSKEPAAAAATTVIAAATTTTTNDTDGSTEPPNKEDEPTKEQAGAATAVIETPTKPRFSGLMKQFDKQTNVALMPDKDLTAAANAKKAEMERKAEQERKAAEERAAAEMAAAREVAHQKVQDLKEEAATHLEETKEKADKNMVTARQEAHQKVQDLKDQAAAKLEKSSKKERELDVPSLDKPAKEEAGMKQKDCECVIL